MNSDKSLKNRILTFLMNYPKDKWINGCELERLALSAGYKASNASRRCRELFDEGKLERKLDKTVFYRYKQFNPEIYSPEYLKIIEKQNGGGLIWLKNNVMLVGLIIL